MKTIFLFFLMVIFFAPHAQAEKLLAIRATHQPSLQAELADKGLQLGNPIFIRVFKQEKMVEVWVQETGKQTFDFFKRYPICVFSGTLGPKLREGDLQSPEGFYDVTYDRLHPGSRYHLAFNLGYPNEFDRARDRTGDFLMIHGGCESKGCYAMTDEVMEEIYVLAEAALYAGQANIDVHVFPFIMTRKNFSFHRKSTWMPFWRSLKPAYDAFQRTRIPPKIHVRQARYVIEPRESYND